MRASSLQFVTNPRRHTRAWLAALVGFGAMGAGWTIVETASDAHSPEATRQAAIAAAVQEWLDQSSGALLVQYGDEMPFTNVLIWRDDAADPGRINRGELALLSHSTPLQCLSVYEWRGSSDRANDPIERGQVEAPGFVEAWRVDPDVTIRVIARGISDLVVRRQSAHDDAHAPEIQLIWASKRADSTGERGRRAHSRLQRKELNP